ncbi:MAG: hypothetical protein L0H31_10905 [Nocardioidaceae bacterium]|nr:hypothetical protein [Nocardioidaceae bacterium]
MRRSRLFAPALAPLLATTLFLGACNSDDDVDTKSNDTPSATSDTASDAASDGAGETASTSPSSDSTGTTVSAGKAGVKFDLPEGWEVIGAEQMGANGNGPELARSLGLTEDELRTRVQNLDLLAHNGKAENLNVVSGTVPQLPTGDVITQQYKTRLNFTVTSTSEISTAVGDGIKFAWTLPDNKSSNRAGAGVFIDVDGTIVNISAIGRNAETTNAVIDQAIATIATD